MNFCNTLLNWLLLSIYQNQVLSTKQYLERAGVWMAVSEIAKGSGKRLFQSSQTNTLSFRQGCWNPISWLMPQTHVAGNGVAGSALSRCFYALPESSFRVET
jgi:hypothetical protein